MPTDITVITSSALVVIGAIIAAIVAASNKKLTAQFGNNAVTQAGESAIGALAQMVLAELASLAAHNPTLIVPAAIGTAIAKWLPYVETALTAAGLTPAVIEARVTGEVLKVLHLAPTATEPAPLTSTEAAKAQLNTAAPVAAGTAPV